MLTIYKASAGSGKTFTLALVYIKNLLGIKLQGTDSYRLNHPKYNAEKKQIANRHRHILAITFTNKATEEMKRRIVNELSALARVPGAGGKDTDYGPMLCAEFGCSRPELAQVAATALRQLLYDYQSFNVTTIDSFFQRVLRSFARELDRQGDFNIELNDKAAVQMSVGTMIDDFNKDASALPHLSHWIYNYMLALLNEGSKNNFFNRKANVHTSLVETVTKICEEKFKPFASQMREYLKEPRRLVELRKTLKDARKAPLAAISKLTAELLRQWEAHGVYTDQINGRLNIKKYLENELLNGIEIPKKVFFDSDTIIGYIEGKSPFTQKFKGSEADLDLLAEFLLRTKTEYRKMYTIDAICKCLDQLGLLANAWQYIDKFSAENNTVLLSDTNHLLEKVIGNESTPFIYEKMGLQLHHFLIDEFQDTSKMQWDNLKPLLANSLAEDYDSLIIGDEKQSIYRFRNSDSSLLHTQVANEDFPRDSVTRGANPGENTNYRSSPVVVNFNNSLFTVLARQTGVEGFENVVQEIAPHKTHTPGYVMLMQIPKDKKGAEDPDAAPMALKAMVKNMLRQHNEGHYPWGEIAVLVEKNKQAATVVSHLMGAGIPVASDEALYLVKSPAVQLIVGILKILANYPSAEASAIRMEEETAKKDESTSRTKKRFATPAQLSMVMSRLEYFRSTGMEIEEAIEAAAKYLDQDTPVADSIAVGVEAVRSRKPSSLISIVETIIKEQIPREMKKSQVAYLAAFQDFVSEYCSRYNPTLKAFISAWEDTKSKLTIASGADVDAVKVMTIHKSKGLEFPCVHIPFGSWDMFGGKDNSQWVEFPDMGLPRDICPPAIYLTMSSLYDSPDSPFYEAYATERHQCLVDTMNKTYVAYTRAGAELMVYFNPDTGLGEYLNKILAEDSLPECHISCRDFTPDDADASEDSTPDIKIFEISEPTVKAQKAEAKADSDSGAPKKCCLDGYYTYYHNGAQNVITCVADALDLDSDIAEADAIPSAADPADYHDEEARLRGVMLHDTLSLIEHRSDIDSAIKYMSKSKKLSPEHAAELKAMIEEMVDMDHPHIRRWFEDYDARVLNEQTVYLHDDDMNKRLDRLMIYPDGSVEIIDYKFTSDTEMKLRKRSHHKQVRAYILALKDMGYPDVKGYLWYPFQKKIENVECKN